MSRKLLAVALAVGSTATSVVHAEDFRIATTVYDLSVVQDNGKPKAVTTSLSLFHHRKVYDYISTEGEVVIFDAAARTFTLLNTARSLATTVEFDEIKHMLKIARMETDKYVAQQNQLGTSISKQVAEALSFQLAPKFETSLTKSTGTVSYTHLTLPTICSV